VNTPDMLAPDRPSHGLADLAAAVSKADTMGIITCLTQRAPELLATEIARSCRAAD
jgi:hypothetical protein